MRRLIKKMRYATYLTQGRLNYTYISLAFNTFYWIKIEKKCNILVELGAWTQACFLKVAIAQTYLKEVIKSKQHTTQ